MTSNSGRLFALLFSLGAVLATVAIIGLRSIVPEQAHAQVGPGSGNAPYQYTSSGAGQYGVSIGSSTTLTIPSGSLIAEICVETATARYTTTGTTPTSSVGVPIASGGCFQLAGIANLTAFKIIGSGATMDVEYFR